MARRGYDVGLVTGHLEPHEASALQLVGGPSCPLHTLDDLGRGVGGADVRAFAELLRLIRRVRPDVVHTHAAKAGTLGRLSAAAAGVPIRVHSFHGHVFHGYFGPAVSAGIRLFERTLGLTTSAVLVPGASQKIEIARRFGIVPERKIVVAPYGVDSACLRSPLEKAEARRRLGVTARFAIGAVGRMAPIKNQRLLVAAFALLRRLPGAPEVQLVLAGEGECRDALVAQVKDLGLEQEVRFQPFQQSLASLYAGLDVLAISSLNEGMPVAALEAMWAGVAVVSTAVGGVVDLVRDGETGWLVPSGNRDALAHALRASLTSGDRAKIIEAARCHVENHHTFEHACDALAGVYESLLARAVSPGPMRAA